MKPENKAMLTRILTYHVVPAAATSKDAMAMIKSDGGKHVVKTVEGAELTLAMRGDNLTITDAKGGVATVTQADVMQSNGVVHVIDTVLMPNLDAEGRGTLVPRPLSHRILFAPLSSDRFIRPDNTLEIVRCDIVIIWALEKGFAAFTLRMRTSRNQ